MAKFTREQVRRRQTVALVIVVILTLIAGYGCVRISSAVVSRIFPGQDETEQQVVADPWAMKVPFTDPYAPILSQLPEGVSLAVDETMGIDVSAHQHEIDWQAVAADGVTFAYIKATEGVGHLDPNFETNWEGAQTAGITVGAYHYFTLCSPGAAQAEEFLAAAPRMDAALPPVVDLEFDGACNEKPAAEIANQEVEDFVTAVEAAWGRKVVVYSSSEWRQLYGLPIAEGRPQWLFAEHDRPGDDQWAVWQFRFTGQVAGITGDVDLDVMRPEQLRELSKLDKDA